MSSDRPQSRRAAQVEGLLRSLDLGPTGTVESRSKAAAEWLHLTDDDSLNGGLEVITGRTVLILHIGTPIAQVRAPGLINIALERASVDASVIPVDIAPDHLNEAFALLRHIPNVCGALITMPHKSVAIDLVDSVEGDALAIGAINAIRVEAGKLVGANFDGIGLVAGAADVGIEFRGRSVLLIGSGGAGKAIAFALAESGVTRLTIANRTATSAEELAGRLVESFPDLSVALGPAVASTEHAVVINATPLGMRESDPLPVSIDALASDSAVIDAITSPVLTALLASAQNRGLVTMGGRGMLEGQVEQLIRFWLR